MKKLFLIPCLILSLNPFAQNAYDLNADKLKNQITLSPTTAEKPVSMNACIQRLKINDTEKTIVAVRIKIHENWHIYAYVPEGGFFIQSNLSLELSNGYQSKILIEPKNHGYEADPSIMIYKGDLLFVYEIIYPKEITTEELKLKVVLDYQACDPYACLAPDQLTKELEFTNAK